MKTNFTDGLRCDLPICPRRALIWPAPISGLRGMGRAGPAGVGTGTPGLEPTRLFRRTEFSGALSAGDSTRRCSFTGLRIFMARICITGSMNFMGRTDMVMGRRGADSAAANGVKRIDPLNYWRIYFQSSAYTVRTTRCTQFLQILGLRRNEIEYTGVCQLSRRLLRMLCFLLVRANSG